MPRSALPQCSTSPVLLHHRTHPIHPPHQLQCETSPALRPGSHPVTVVVDGAATASSCCFTYSGDYTPSECRSAGLGWLLVRLGGLEQSGCMPCFAHLCSHVNRRMRTHACTPCNRTATRQLYWARGPSPARRAARSSCSASRGGWRTTRAGRPPAAPRTAICRAWLL